MSRLLIAEAAEEEYTESLKWYAERSLRAAERFDAAFEQALDSIAAHPERYPLCDDRHRFYLLKGYPFQIIYRRASENQWLVVAGHRYHVALGSDECAPVGAAADSLASRTSSFSSPAASAIASISRR